MQESYNIKVFMSINGLEYYTNNNHIEPVILYYI